jgi:hypothetical protein
MREGQQQMLRVSFECIRKSVTELIGKKMLVKKVDAWNKWRDEHAGTRPDLTETNLFQANLSEAFSTRRTLTP